MVFEWDEIRNRANAARHGIDFETARRIFDGRVLTHPDWTRDYEGELHVSIGRLEDAVIVVAHTDRGVNVRLAWARPASRAERQAWHDSIR